MAPLSSQISLLVAMMEGKLQVCSECHLTSGIDCTSESAEKTFLPSSGQAFFRSAGLSDRSWLPLSTPRALTVLLNDERKGGIGGEYPNKSKKLYQF